MNKKQEEISNMILDYFHKHPDAKDTLEGITKWWLNVEKIDVSVDDVSIALESLVKDGHVEKQLIKDSNHILEFAKRIKK